MSDCVMYGECGQTINGAKYNCKYTGKAKLLSESKDNLFRQMCPHLFKNSPIDNQTYTCCDPNQIDRLNDGLSIPRQLMSHCPACFLNFRTFLCDIICSPNQNEFLIVTSEQPYISEQNKPIDESDFNLDNLFDTLNDTKKMKKIEPSSNDTSSILQLEVVRLTYHLTSHYAENFYNSCK